MKEIYKKAIVNIIFSIVVMVLILLLVPRVWKYFLPFLFAWLIAACASPIVHFLEKKIKLKRKMGSVIVIVAVIALIVLLMYLALSTLFGQLVGWLGSLPDLFVQLSDVMDEVVKTLVSLGILKNTNFEGLLQEFGAKILSALSTIAEGGSQSVISFIGGATKQIPLFLIGLFVCLLSAYFFVAEKGEEEESIKKLIPLSVQNKWKILTDSMKQAFGGYMKAQVKIEVWIYLVLVLGLFILQVDYALLIALLIAFLDFLPLFGAGIVMIPWAVVEIFCKNYKLAVGLVIIWGLTQILRQMLQPKYVGESVGIKPLPTLILLYTGYCIAGMWGLILAIPIGYVLINLYKAGLFDGILNSLKILVNGFNEYRRIEDGEEEKHEEIN